MKLWGTKDNYYLQFEDEIKILGQLGWKRFWNLPGGKRQAEKVTDEEYSLSSTQQGSGAKERHIYNQFIKKWLNFFTPQEANAESLNSVFSLASVAQIKLVLWKAPHYVPWLDDVH